jgi:hypothetical protein
MSRPVFGVDRDPVASATWGMSSDPGFEDDDGQWVCELHDDDREACREFEAQAEELVDFDGQPR